MKTWSGSGGLPRLERPGFEISDRRAWGITNMAGIRNTVHLENAAGLRWSSS